MTPTDSLELFRRAYRALTDNPEPFPWQEEFFRRLCASRPPGAVAVPTGCGKTSAMIAWLVALAWQARSGPRAVSLPRRLVWVVNRRVVVDQATTEAADLQERLRDKSREELEPIRIGLRQICPENTDELLGVSTLRGQLADNAEWRAHPSRPAIVIGTVDMIGSRLLFSGYGPGFKYRPLHAGFIGQDALLIHDEAHLEPAFQKLIQAVAEEQERCGDFRCLCVIGLTATSRERSEDLLALTEADRRHDGIRARIEARKGLALQLVDGQKKVAGAVLDAALEFKDSGKAILIFLLRLEDVQEVKGQLEKRGLKCLPFTGTMRGYERDQMAESNPIFARFLPKPKGAPEPGTVYLICTSAGEVGVNMSADHLVCDLTPFESMMQRFGRVNRFGSGDARIEVVCSPTDPEAKKAPEEQKYDESRRLTLALLKHLPQREDGRYDASPAALDGLPLQDRQQAFSPPPEIVPTSEILFDAWALTSVRGKKKMPGRPPVADWIHGISKWEPPQTYVAWRQEVEEIAGELIGIYPPEDLLEDYPLKPHELLRDTSHRVVAQLKKIAGREPTSPVWVIDAGGDVTPRELNELVSGDKPEETLADCTVLLPPKAGGLAADGMLDGNARFEEGTERYDIAGKWLDESGSPRRSRLWDSELPKEMQGRMRLVRKIDTHPDADEMDNDESEPRRRLWRWFVRVQSADDDGSVSALRDQEWTTHTESAERIALDLTTKLGLGDKEASAVVHAAKWHDLGKRRRLWQLSIGNRDFPERTLAKSEGGDTGIRITNRHEFGSLIDVSTLPEFTALCEDARDLVLHIIAAHHGRARPHFTSDEASDPEFPEAQYAAIERETPRRFVRLQRRYGRWGLAYLESLLRSADALASQRSEPPASVAIGDQK